LGDHRSECSEPLGPCVQIHARDSYTCACSYAMGTGGQYQWMQREVHFGADVVEKRHQGPQRSGNLPLWCSPCGDGGQGSPCGDGEDTMNMSNSGNAVHVERTMMCPLGGREGVIFDVPKSEIEFHPRPPVWPVVVLHTQRIYSYTKPRTRSRWNDQGTSTHAERTRTGRVNANP
jgi:hypothetical protein